MISVFGRDLFSDHTRADLLRMLPALKASRQSTVERKGKREDFYRRIFAARNVGGGETMTSC
jgi:hypothetical protein